MSVTADTASQPDALLRSTLADSPNAVASPHTTIAMEIGDD